VDDPQVESQQAPWQQRVLDSIWMLALAAVVFFFLSYVVWGLIDLLSVGTGG
jgi:uncharacterized BrkB/YihY/UPF0761 family membrane protein